METQSVTNEMKTEKEQILKMAKSLLRDYVLKQKEEVAKGGGSVKLVYGCMREYVDGADSFLNYKMKDRLEHQGFDCKTIDGFYVPPGAKNSDEKVRPYYWVEARSKVDKDSYWIVDVCASLYETRIDCVDIPQDVWVGHQTPSCLSTAPKLFPLSNPSIWFENVKKDNDSGSHLAWDTPTGILRNTRKNSAPITEEMVQKEMKKILLGTKISPLVLSKNRELGPQQALVLAAAELGIDKLPIIDSSSVFQNVFGSFSKSFLYHASTQQIEERVKRDLYKPRTFEFKEHGTNITFELDWHAGKITMGPISAERGATMEYVDLAIMQILDLADRNQLEVLKPLMSDEEIMSEDDREFQETVSEYFCCHGFEELKEGGEKTLIRYPLSERKPGVSSSGPKV